MFKNLIIASVIVVVIAIVSRTSFGVRRLSPDTIQNATLLYETMNKWRAEGRASKSLLLGRDNLMYACAYANILRSMLDDVQSQNLFHVNMLRTLQDIQRELNAKTKELLTKCPSLNPSRIGSGANIPSGTLAR